VRPHALSAAPICAECRSAEASWQQVSGRGEVYTYTIVHRPIAAGQPLPTVIAVIALEGAGGVRIISNLVGVDADAVRIGCRRAGLGGHERGSRDPRFRPR
jgi:uncharacterized OB-fold protein